MAEVEYKERQGREIQLWRTWKTNPTEATLEPLMKSFENMVGSQVNMYKGAPVPPAAIHGHANTLLLKALNSYSPDKGAGLGTHVFNHLKKTQAFVHKHQNLGKIPDQRARNIRPYQSAVSELTEQFGHEPDSLSLAEHLGWSQREVERMQNELSRRDLIASRSPEADQIDELFSQKEREALRYIHYDLTPMERTVFEYTLGVYGKPQLSAAAIARTMSISQPKVSRIRKKIDQKLRLRGV